MTTKTAITMLFLILFLSLSSITKAFLLPKPNRHNVPTFIREDASSYHSETMLEMAKKKKKRVRRKNIDASQGEADSGTLENGMGDIAEPQEVEIKSLKEEIGDELPEFDLSNEEDDAGSIDQQTVQTTPQTSPSSSSPNDLLPMDDPVVMKAMKGSGSRNLEEKSVKDLLADRDLEKNFVFKEEDTDKLPSLVEIGKKVRNVEGVDTDVKVGKKRARAEARKAAAIEAQAQEEDGGGILSKIPFIESGKDLSPIDIVQNLTWLGIFLLVAWELYINSPFFERAEPLIPVVYDFFL